jgi:hypothetical protein
MAASETEGWSNSGRGTAAASLNSVKASDKTVDVSVISEAVLAPASVVLLVVSGSRVAAGTGAGGLAKIDICEITSLVLRDSAE